MSWLEQVFGVSKPVIAMCHLPALPGDPAYDADGGLEAVVEVARSEIAALQAGGVDAIMISNEFSLPYLTTTEPITAISMARVIGEVRREITVPFGVNVLWDGTATIDLAAATGAAFGREIYTGVYASDFGLWNTDVGRTARHRQRLGATGVRLIHNIVPEGAAYLADRDLAKLTRSTVFNAKPDALAVSGLTAGAGTDAGQLRTVKEAAGTTPVFANTGVNPTTVEATLEIADGAVVGTFFKHDGVFEHQVDTARVDELMTIVRRVRGG